MTTRRLSPGQRRVIGSEGVEWVGWDSRGRPVVKAYYYSGFLQPLDPDQRNSGSTLRQWAIKRDGEPIDVTYPIQHQS
jgi:hypothetical protein